MIIFTIFILFSFHYIFQSKCENRVLNIIKSLNTKKDTKILDLGCGSCCLSKMLQNQNMEGNVTSIDVVHSGKCSIPRLFDGENIPFEDKTFDIGVCAFVLHHTEKQEKLLKELKRTCWNVIILEDTPKTQSEWYYAYQHARSKWGSCRSCFHTSEEWIDIFEKNGFFIKKIETTNKWMCPFAKQPFLYPVTQTTFFLTENIEKIN